MIEIKVDSAKVNSALERLSHSVADMSPIMKNISGILDDAVHENFKQQGRPKWDDLSTATKKMRTKNGHWPGSILQQKGKLIGAIGTEFGSDYSRVGVQTGLASKYAAMQQFGGTTSPRSMIPGRVIPARPFLSITDADETKILETVSDYLRSLIS